MSDKKENTSIDQMADTYVRDERDEKAYVRALNSTIVSLNKEINGLKKEIEKLAGENERLLMENAQLKALSPAGEFSTTAEETICLVQLEMLKNQAMTRELTLEECKKSEIFLKMLLSIRGKNAAKEEEKVEKISNEDLLKFMDSLGPGAKDEQ